MCYLTTQICFIMLISVKVNSFKSAVATVYFYFSHIYTYLMTPSSFAIIIQSIKYHYKHFISILLSHEYVC